MSEMANAVTAELHSIARDRGRLGRWMDRLGVVKALIGVLTAVVALSVAAATMPGQQHSTPTPAAADADIVGTWGWGGSAFVFSQSGSAVVLKTTAGDAPVEVAGSHVRFDVPNYGGGVSHLELELTASNRLHGSLTHPDQTTEVVDLVRQ
jgi:hypothetical protein